MSFLRRTYDGYTRITYLKFFGFTAIWKNGKFMGVHRKW